MTNRLLEKGKEGLIDGTIDVDTNTMKLGLIDPATATTAIKAITGATNATPIVVTATAHGFTNGDVVVVMNVGGNTAANNIWKIKNVATNTFELASVLDGTTNSVGNGAYTSGGVAICLGPSASGDNLDDYSGAIVGTSQTLTSPTVTNGKFGAANPSFPAIATGPTIRAMLVWKDTGTPSTSRGLSFHDGTHQVICNAQAAASATSIAVEPLQQAIASGATLVFSNGASATLSAGAAAGDRALTVSALAAIVAAGAYAAAPVTSSGLPLVANGSTVNVTIDTTNGVFRLL